MRRFTVLGFTEAELGFVLAALFAALAVGAYEGGVDPQNHVLISKQRDSLAVAISSTKAERDSVANILTALRDSIKSTKTPNCWERGEPRGAIAEVRVLGADQYELGGVQLNWLLLREKLQPHIARSTSLRCRYSVIARSTRGVDAVDNTTAMRRLRLLFDVSELAE